MAEPTPPVDESESAASAEEQAIRDRVRALTTQALQQGRIDPEGVKEVVRSVTGGDDTHADIRTDEARRAFADAIKSLDAALQESAGAAHDALQRLSSRGKDFTDNDLKDALVGLRRLQEDFVSIANRITEVTSGTLRSELIDLAVNAQNVGSDVGSRIAGMMGEFAGRIGSESREKAATGLETARSYGGRMALLTSGILAGVGDALRDHSKTKTDE